MYGDGFFNGMGGGMWLGPLFMFGLPLALIAFVVWWVMGTRRSDNTPGRLKDARALLDERFARDEIDEDEYRRRRDAIES